MVERVIAGGKSIGKTPWAPRVAIAVALSACAFTEGGCMAPKHPECAFYFRGENAKACEGVRCKLTDARKKLRELEGEEKLAARSLRTKIERGEECEEELDMFNSIHAEIGRISKKLDGYTALEFRIRDGKAAESELQDAFDEITAIWGKIVGFEQALVQISRNI